MTHPEFVAPGVVSRFMASDPSWAIVSWDDGSNGVHPTNRLSLVDSGITLRDQCPRCGVDALRILSSDWTDPKGSRKYDCGTVMTTTGNVLTGEYCEGGRFYVE